MKDKLKSLAITTVLNFAKGAASGFAFSVGSRLACDLIDRVRGVKQVETKTDSRVSVRDIPKSKLN